MREDRAEAIASVLAAHADDLAEADAIKAVDAIAEWSATKPDGPIRSLVAFVNSRTLEDLQRWAGKPHVASRSTARSSTAPRITHGKRCDTCRQPIVKDGSCACVDTSERAS